LEDQVGLLVRVAAPEPAFVAEVLIDRSRNGAHEQREQHEGASAAAQKLLS
jgi:hypothetical protein